MKSALFSTERSKWLLDEAEQNTGGDLTVSGEQINYLPKPSCSQSSISFLTNSLLRKVLFLLCYHHDHHFYNYHYVDYDDSDDIMMMIIIIMIIISVMVPYVSFTWTCSFPFHSAHFLADHSS